MKHLILILTAALLVGCGSSPTIASAPVPQDVRIQFMGAGDWEATALVLDGDSRRRVAKPGYDTAEFVLGALGRGATFTLRTGEGRYLFFTRPDSVRIIIGRDTLIRYWPEAGEAVYVVR